MEKEIREDRLGPPEVLYILQRLDAIDEKYDKKIEALRLELKGDILNVRDELKGEIKSVRDELKGEIKAVRDEVKDELRGTKKELTALFWRIVGIIIAVQGAAIAILQLLK